jgi:hypothetical protein
MVLGAPLLRGNRAEAGAGANGTASNKTSKIAVNDHGVGTLPFGGTGGRSSWKTNSITVTLKKGINKIRVTSVAEGPNLDKVVIAASP